MPLPDHEPARASNGPVDWARAGNAQSRISASAAAEGALEAAVSGSLVGEV